MLDLYIKCIIIDKEENLHGLLKQGNAGQMISSL